jgi:hypothetical protein
VLVVGVAGLYGWHHWKVKRTNGILLAHVYNEANHRMRVIGGTIQQYALEVRELPVTLTNGSARVTGHDLYQTIKSSEIIDRLARSESSLQKIFTDPWGKYYNITFSHNNDSGGGSDESTYDVVIWTYGANGRDDSMANDDLVERYEIVVQRLPNK